MERTLSSTGSPTAVFHVDFPVSPKMVPARKIPDSPGSKMPETGQKVSALKKVIGKIGLDRPLPSPPKEVTAEHHWGADMKDFVIVSNVPPPTELPPPVPNVYGRRRK